MAKQPAVLDTLTATVKAAQFGKLARYMVFYQGDDGVRARRAFCRGHLFECFRSLHIVNVNHDPNASGWPRAFQQFSRLYRSRPAKDIEELVTLMTSPDATSERGYICDVVSPALYQCSKCARVSVHPGRNRSDHHEDWMSKPHHKR